MKNTIVNLIAVVAVSFSSMVFAAGEIESKAQPAAAMPAPAASGVPAATVVESTASAPAEEPQSTAGRAKARTFRPKDMDLRHCLELDNNPAIAKCAHE